MSQIQRELVIQSSTQGYDIALLENKELVEFHRDHTHSTGVSIGDIYWARVRKLLPPLNAAFIDIGEQKEAFLHYTDLGENFSTLQAFMKRYSANDGTRFEDFKKQASFPKEGKITEVLNIGDFLPVEVLKEPMNTKGAKLSSDLSLAGRYLVLVPFSNQINISKKIQDKAERERLKEIGEKLCPKNHGLIIRTVALGKSVKELHEDILKLEGKWERILDQLKNAGAIKRLYEEDSKSNTLLRDILNDSFSKIHVNSSQAAAAIEANLLQIAPEMTDLLEVHSDGQNIFETFSLNSKIKSAFNKIIPLKSGGYIILEQTEALFVIDVNSGLSLNKKSDLNADDTILKVNLEAAKEIARQLRLRDIGGIIVIDFIDSKNPQIKDKIYEAMLSYMQTDKANHTILPLSKFCLMQITRSRSKPQEKIKTTESCPSCLGSGKVMSTILISDMIFNKLQATVTESRKFRIKVHPYVFAYLKHGFPSLYMKWQWKLKRRFHIEENSDLGINQYQMVYADGQIESNSLT